MGRGNYLRAPPEGLMAALAGVERKQREAALQLAYRDALVAGELPDAIRTMTRELLFRPDRGRIEYKALVDAASQRRLTPERLLLATGAIESPAALHRERFVFEQFPHGAGFPDVRIPAIEALPVAEVEAFSIDDEATTEIDDALSVTTIDPPPDAPPGSRAWRIGIHIAAPGLAIERGDAIDAIARERYSTVYAPGDKITMLPDAVVEAFTLAAGRACPALSLYVDAVDTGADAEGWDIVASTSRIERVPIADNLRHNALDAFVTEDNLAADRGDYPHKAELSVLWHFARALHARRQAARVASGLRPESYQRSDYNFRVDAVDGVDRVSITERRRGAPLDTIVAELMILANSTWGRLLADHGVPGIYRAQAAAFGPAGRVRMVTHPAPHAGLGVAQYSWSTSPLRRYIDLVNQWQIAACIDAARIAPFARNDADLFAIVSGFDAAYGAYAEYQAKMERYWCLRWLEQERRTIVEARATGREDHAMLLEVPLLVRVPGMSVAGAVAVSASGTTVTRGQRIEIEILSTDLVDLAVQCRLVAIIEEVDAVEMGDEPDEAEDGIASGSAQIATAEATIEPQSLAAG